MTTPARFSALPYLRDVFAESPSTTAQGLKRIPQPERIVEAACLAAEARVGQKHAVVSCLRSSKGLIGAGWRVASVAVRLYVWLFRCGYAVYERLPKNVLQAVFGLALAFFGGTYLVTLAAVEAFCKVGGEVLWDELAFIYEQARAVDAASAADGEPIAAATTTTTNSHSHS